MSPYLRPGWLNRVIGNRLVNAFGFATTLAVKGRTTGEWRTVPVDVLEHEGDRYLVAPRGETQWVRNLRAAGRGELRRKGEVEPFTAIEVADPDKGPIIAAYREKGGRTVKPFFEKLPHDADHPVFKVMTLE